MRDVILDSQSRSVTPILSNSISNISIHNCNRKFWDKEKEGEELELWGLANEISVVCLENKDNILLRLVEMEEKDTQLLTYERIKGSK